MDNIIPKLNLKMTDIPWIECECGGRMFDGSMMIKKISGLLNKENGEERLLPVEIFVCRDCGKVPGFINSTIPTFPDELKAIKPIAK